MAGKKIEDVMKNVLKGEAQENALNFISHVRKLNESGVFPINMNDENDESGWNVDGLGFIVVTGGEDFPGPWAMWLMAENIGEHTQNTEDDIKEFAWSHVSPCGSCGGDCSPGTTTKVFGKTFENVCQHNLMFVNPDSEAVRNMKRIADIKKADALAAR